MLLLFVKLTANGARPDVGVALKSATGVTTPDTTTASLAVQPLAVFVTVSVYTPGVTTGDVVVPPEMIEPPLLVQLYVKPLPELDPDASSEACVDPQPSV